MRGPVSDMKLKKDLCDDLGLWASVVPLKTGEGDLESVHSTSIILVFILFISCACLFSRNFKVALVTRVRMDSGHAMPQSTKVAITRAIRAVVVLPSK
jgi:hypothetical protein